MASVSKDFAASASDVTAARQFVMETVSSWGLDPANPGLVTAELAANALVHAESPFTVSVRYETNRLVVEVTDEGPGLDDESDVSVLGLGLTIVDRLSKWGVRRNLRGGKTVWAELNA